MAVPGSCLAFHIDIKLLFGKNILLLYVKAAADVSQHTYKVRGERQVRPIAFQTQEAESISRARLLNLNIHQTLTPPPSGINISPYLCAVSHDHVGFISADTSLKPYPILSIIP